VIREDGADTKRRDGRAALEMVLAAYDIEPERQPDLLPVQRDRA